MASNPYVNKVEANGTVLIDLTGDDATAADVAQGRWFHLASGERVQGTFEGADRTILVVVSASSTYSSSYPAQNAFGDGSDAWWGADSGSSTWLKMSFSEPVEVTGITFANTYVAGSYHWSSQRVVFQGSSDNSAWVDLYDAQGLSDDAGNLFTFSIPDSAKYSHYRFLCYRSSRYYSGIGRVRLKYAQTSSVVIQPLSVTQNGTYTPASGVDGYAPVTVAVPNTYAASDEGKVVSNEALVAQTGITVTQNGTYDTTTNDEVTVSVSGGGGGAKNILSGTGMPTASDGEDGDIYLLLSVDLVPTGATTNLIAGQNASSAYKLYDGDDSTFWTTKDRNYNDMYVGYDTGAGNPAACTGVSINPRQWNNNVQIGDFKVQASNDLTTWDDIASLTVPNDPATYAGVWTRFDLQNDTAYRAWRVLAITLNGSVTFTLYGLQFHVGGTTISATYLKVNGSWVPIDGQSIDDVNTGGGATS